MDSLIKQIYSPKDVQSIQLLNKEESNKPLLLQAIGHKLLTSEKITVNQPLNVLCLITCTAPFAESDNECFAVSVAIYSLMKVNDILPSLEKHRYAAFSNRALISLSFFPEAMDKRYKNGGPRPMYYQQTAETYYRADNLESLANNFSQWKKWLPEKLF